MFFLCVLITNCYAVEIAPLHCSVDDRATGRLFPATEGLAYTVTNVGMDIIENGKTIRTPQ